MRWLLLLALALALAGCQSDPVRPLVISEPVEVQVPVPVRMPPPEQCTREVAPPDTPLLEASDPRAVYGTTREGLEGLLDWVREVGHRQSACRGD